MAKARKSWSIVKITGRETVCRGKSEKIAPPEERKWLREIKFVEESSMNDTSSGESRMRFAPALLHGERYEEFILLGRSIFTSRFFQHDEGANQSYESSKQHG
jgi:hypothetical protein